jgi:SAM-dependent methyltransferase
VRTQAIDPIVFVPNSDLYEVTEAPFLWNVNSVVLSQDKTTIAGWSLPHWGWVENTHIVVNGRPFVPERLAPSGVYAELYPWHPNAALSAFTIDILHSEYDIRREREITIESRAILDPRKERGYTLDLLLSDLSFAGPPPDVAARIGAENLLHYVMFGRAIFRGFEKALKKNFQKTFADFPAILDWGCGSARVARHVVADLGANSTLVGFDIDSFAVEWANVNVGPHFKACGAQPPLDQPTNSVDLIYAYSVFSHLAEDNMTIWLAELARVLKPGGVGLFTVLSDNAMIALHAGMPRATLEAWREQGIYDSAQNNQLESIGVSGDYYRNVWLTRSFIEKKLGDEFELVDFIGCFHFYQDLVVVRRRK